eukprot:TRINITY_DN63376_c0_g1_i1.p1 TRINITY_DN63376_c0_g1~~TRINITY_DN63376_c0_g1_i1.p1  ORF type:complete len:336 (-),score=12.49 TRINITY_DN63376_c0_g1_i1:108-1115(-)
MQRIFLNCCHPSPVRQFMLQRLPHKMLQSSILLLLPLAFFTMGTAQVSSFTSMPSTSRIRNPLQRTTSSHALLLRHISTDHKFLSAGSTGNPHSLPTIVRPGLNGDACTVSTECEEPRTCVQFDESTMGFVPCASDDCTCLQDTVDRLCTTNSDCGIGEGCGEAESGLNLCFSSFLVDGELLDFEPCTASTQCPSERVCFGTTLSSGVLDCTTSQCSCLRIASNCDTFQDCLMGTACVRISPEIPASFCVANAFVLGNFPSGLTLSGCTSDADCAGARSCVLAGEQPMPCGGADGCFCAGGGANLGCTSSRFCDFGETCSSDGENAFCRAVADLV